MLFNSYLFVLAFLPIALAGYFAVARVGGRRAAGVWLIAASLVFYGWWNPSALPLLAVSIAVNFGIGRALLATPARSRLQPWLLGAGITADLGALVYYKYLAWLLGLANLSGWAHEVTLPLGISFFTFTQILFLVDCRQGVTRSAGALDYGLFVTFFPHLIAGPILHHRDMMPQFADPATYRFRAENMAGGLGFFIVGMLKKGLIADPTGAGVAAAFAAPQTLGLFAAWHAALSYSMQLYFDFSGYSDMAVGLGLMFNLRLPLNFNSPYKAAGIIAYWQRWHMTLTRTITVLLYNPIALGVQRRRAARGLGALRAAQTTVGGFASLVMLPTVITMAIAGLWHGAGAPFLIFGLLHAAYLTINHAWRILHPVRAGSRMHPVRHAASVLLTYLAVLVAAVFFRAPTVRSALGVLAGMAGLHGATLAPTVGASTMAGGWPDGVRNLAAFGWLAGLFVIVWCLPNSQQIFAAARPVLDRIVPGPLGWLRWRMSMGWAIALGFAGVLAVLSMGGTGEFLYFRF